MGIRRQTSDWRFGMTTGEIYEPPRRLQGGKAAVDDLGRVGEGRRLLVYPGARGPGALARREEVPGVDPEPLRVLPIDAFRKLPRPLSESVHLAS
jgi:hypothetical protein